MVLHGFGQGGQGLAQLSFGDEPHGWWAMSCEVVLCGEPADMCSAVSDGVLVEAGVVNQVEVAIDGLAGAGAGG